MSNKIRIDSDLMRERAEEYRKEASKLEGITAKLDNLLTALQSEWEGTSSDNFSRCYGELRPTFVKTSELTLDIATALDKVAQQMFETDHRMARWF